MVSASRNPKHPVHLTNHPPQIVNGRTFARLRSMPGPNYEFFAAIEHRETISSDLKTIPMRRGLLWLSRKPACPATECLESPSWHVLAD